MAAPTLDDEFMIAMPNTSLTFDSPMQFDFNGLLMGASSAICVPLCIPFGMWRKRLFMTPAMFSEVCTV